MARRMRYRDPTRSPIFPNVFQIIPKVHFKRLDGSRDITSHLIHIVGLQFLGTVRSSRGIHMRDLIVHHLVYVFFAE